MVLSAALRSLGVTAREAEVLDALGKRMTNAEIAVSMHISVRTVESHVSSLLRKLGEPDRRALAASARLADVTQVPLPASLADATSGTPLIGREHELSTMLDAAARAGAAGVRRAIVLVGEAGIGKSRLAAEAAQRLHAGGADVVHGRCQQDVLIPYQALVEAASTLDRDVLARLTRPSHRPTEDPGAARYLAFEEFDRLLARRPGLLVFVLDDVQWIDPSGLQLIRHVLHHVGRSPLLLVMTGRPEAMEPHHPFATTTSQAESSRTFDVIELHGLSVDETVAFAAPLATIDTRQAEAVWRRTGGNPFLLSELLRHPDPVRELPPEARDAIIRRLAGMGPQVFDTLTAAAVVGESFSAALLTDMLDGSLDAPADALERAFGAGLIRQDPARPGQYRFLHAIVREALLAVSSLSRRSRLHLAVAEVLDRVGGKTSQTAARHRHTALPGGDPSLARSSAVDAYSQAMSELAFEVAVSFADMELDAVDAGGGHAGDRRRAMLRRARAALAWAEAAETWAVHPDLRATLERVLTDEVDDVGLRARLKAMLAQQLYYAEGARDHRVALGREAVDEAEASEDAETLAAVLATNHAALWEPDDTEHRIGAARQIVAIARSSALPDLEVRGLGYLAVDLLEAGDWRAADEAFASHATLAAELSAPLDQRDAELWAAMRAIMAGSFDAAGERIDRARDIGEKARDPSADTIYWVQRFWLALERDDPAGLDDLVEPCERIANANAEVPAWRAAVGLLHARRGDHAAASAHYSRLAADGFASVPRDVVWLNALTYMAETCAYLRDADHSPGLLATLEPFSGRVALIDRAFACKGSVQRFLGLLAATHGDVVAAERSLRSALDLHTAMGWSPLAERTRRDLLQHGLDVTERG